MNRRDLLKHLAFAAAVAAAGWLARGRWRGSTFYVAGARFGDLPEHVRPGERLVLRRRRDRGRVGFALSTLDGLVLGYVPRDLAPAVEHAGPLEARLAAVDLDAVPWKRYLVELRDVREGRGGAPWGAAWGTRGTRVGAERLVSAACS